MFLGSRDRKISAKVMIDVHLRQPSADVRRHLSMAVSASLGLHAVLLAMLFWHQPPTMLGAPSAVDGQGVYAGAVYLSLERPAGPMPEQKIRAKSAAALSQSDTTSSASDGGSHPLVAEQKEFEDASVSQPSSSGEVRNASLSAAHPAATISAATADVAATGDPDGNQTLLQQIAKCFPVGTAPSLPTVHLQIQVDAGGNLSATPVTDIDLGKSSPEDIRAANTIIQATMLCGPYRLPPETKRRASLLADFSQVAGQQKKDSTAAVDRISGDGPD